MYTVGKGGGTVAAIGSGAAVTQLPVTGDNLFIELALAALVSLIVWAAIYVGTRKAFK